MMVLVVLELAELNNEAGRLASWCSCCLSSRSVVDPAAPGGRWAMVVDEQAGRGTGLEGEWCSTSHPSSAWPNGE